MSLVSDHEGYVKVRTVHALKLIITKKEVGRIRILSVWLSR
jgi:hypothetical protein